MMGRRSFLAMAAATGTASMSGAENAQAAETGGRQVHELRAYHLDSDNQKAGLLSFFDRAAIPAYNRLGVEPVGVFALPEELSPVYVVLPHPSMASVATATDRLMADEAFLAAGADFLNAPATAPAYARVESWLLEAFTGMPRLETPASGPDRVFQLRIYESPSVKTGRKKIEMFNTAEIAIFRKVGLNPVFFGETLIGSKAPNLTYMLGFDNAEAQKAGWNAFRTDPDWLELRAKPEYADDKILCGITNIVLNPADCSQI